MILKLKERNLTFSSLTSCRLLGCAERDIKFSSYVMSAAGMGEKGTSHWLDYVMSAAGIERMNVTFSSYVMSAAGIERRNVTFSSLTSSDSGTGRELHLAGVFAFSMRF